MFIYILFYYPSQNLFYYLSDYTSIRNKDEGDYSHPYYDKQPLENYKKKSNNAIN